LSRWSRAVVGVAVVAVFLEKITPSSGIKEGELERESELEKKKCELANIASRSAFGDFATA